MGVFYHKNLKLSLNGNYILFKASLRFSVIGLKHIRHIGNGDEGLGVQPPGTRN